MKISITMTTAGIQTSFEHFLNLLNGYSSPEILVFSVGILLLSLFFRLWWASSRRENGHPLPPGSLGMPFIGESLEFVLEAKRNRSWDFITSRVTKYGEIFKTSLIGDPTVVFANPAGNKMVFMNQNKLVHVSLPGSVVAVLGTHSLPSLNGDKAKKMRQALAVFLRPEALQIYAGKVDASVRKFIEECWDGMEQVTVLPLMKRFSFSLACELLMSRYEKDEQRMLEKAFTTMIRNMLQLPINLPGTPYRKAMDAAKLLRKHFKKWFEERRKELEQGKAAPDQDLLSCFLCYKDEEGVLLAEHDMLDNTLLMLFAGHDTSTALMTIACKLLAENPTVFEAVWKEQKEVAARKKPEDPLNWADLQHMKLSWRVLLETLRLEPAVQGAFRIAIKDFDYAGFKIPKGWKIYWSANATHRNPKYFSDPAKFDPSRFEGAGPEPYTFVPFGGGSRMCPGSEFARMQALVLMHHLVIRFKWKLVHPDEVITVDPMPYPKKGLPVWLERRTC